MSRRTISVAVLAVAWIVVSQVAASAAPSKYIDGPRNEFGIAVANGYHAWGVDTAAHRYAYVIWVKPDGGPAYQVSSSTSAAYVGNIEVANPTYGDVLIFYSSTRYGRGKYDVKLYDMANHAVIPLPAGIDLSTAAEANPSIGGDYISFERIRLNSRVSRLFLYRISTHTFTQVAAGTNHSYYSQIDGDYLVYDTCLLTTGVCNVFRRQISTGSTVEAPNLGHANYYPTVMADGTIYYVSGSPVYCGHHTRIMKWTGSGGATALTMLPETIEVGQMDAFNDGVSTTLYFTRIRCRTGQLGIYQLPSA